jgi:hypothetical protein
MRTLIAVLALTCLGGSAVAQTPGQAPCAPYEAYAEGLGKRFGERPVLHGVATGGGAEVIIFANPDSGTFSIGMRAPNGMFCLMMTGDGMTPAPGKPSSGPET